MEKILTELDNIIRQLLRRGISGFLFVYLASPQLSGRFYEAIGGGEKLDAKTKLIALIPLGLVVGFVIHSIHKSLPDALIFSLKNCISRCLCNNDRHCPNDADQLHDYVDSKWRWEIVKDDKQEKLKTAMGDWASNLHMLYTCAIAIMLANAYLWLSHGESMNCAQLIIAGLFVIFAFVSDVRKASMQLRARKDA